MSDKPAPLTVAEIDAHVARAALCESATLPGAIVRSLLRMARAVAALEERDDVLALVRCVRTEDERWEIESDEGAMLGDGISVVEAIEAIEEASK